MSTGAERPAAVADPFYEALRAEWKEGGHLAEIHPSVLDNLTLMNQDLVRLPGHIARFAFKVAVATRDHEMAVNNADLLFGKVKEMLRVQRKDEKPTETRLAELARQDKDWQVAEERRIATQARLAALKGLLKALEIKQWALNSLGATARQEMKSNSFDSLRQNPFYVPPKGSMDDQEG